MIRSEKGVLRATLITGIVNCDFSDSEDELVPALLELPLQVRIGAAETTPFGLYVGSLILDNGCFSTVPLVTLLALRRFGDPRKRWVLTLQSKVLSTAAYLGFSYFGPTTAKVFALVMFHESTVRKGTGGELPAAFRGGLRRTAQGCGCHCESDWHGGHRQHGLRHVFAPVRRRPLRTASAVPPVLLRGASGDNAADDLRRHPTA